MLCDDSRYLMDKRCQMGRSNCFEVKACNDFKAKGAEILTVENSLTGPRNSDLGMKSLLDYTNFTAELLILCIDELNGCSVAEVRKFLGGREHIGLLHKDMERTNHKVVHLDILIQSALPKGSKGESVTIDIEPQGKRYTYSDYKGDAADKKTRKQHENHAYSLIVRAIYNTALTLSKELRENEPYYDIKEGIFNLAVFRASDSRN